MNTKVQIMTTFGIQRELRSEHKHKDSDGDRKRDQGAQREVK